jgi:hypothetical protein
LGKKKAAINAESLVIARVFGWNNRSIVVHLCRKLAMLWKRMVVRELQIKVQTWKIIVEVVGWLSWSKRTNL